jgi:predicted dithiol-disulfide oxidoreductase (DUF899 family)
MGTSKPIVNREEWLAARKALLAKEKAFTRERDALSAARREMPLLRIDKPYVFAARDGKRTLADLFDGKEQLLVYHFMFAPSWDAGCKSCSLVAETFDRTVVHLAARNTSFVAISRAPIEKLQAYEKRMGWTFPWVSSGNTDFNFEFNVSFRQEDVDAKNVEYNYTKTSFPTTEAPGFSTFLREGDDVFHAYSTFGRGVDALMNVYHLLDITPLGRQEDGKGMFWVRRRDEYEATSPKA